MLPSIQTTPSCTLCGAHVEPGQQFCAVCEDKPRTAPRATVEIKEQPEPPYHTSGNFRRPPPSKEE
jgi:predicted amidophosphoribosyltransferase